MLGLGLDLSLARSKAGGSVNNGLAIVNSANTTVTTASGGGYHVTKTGGVGGSWDAAAESASTGTLVRIKWIGGVVCVGMSADPTVSTSYVSVISALYWDNGAGIYVFSAGGQQGAVYPHKVYGWVEYIEGTSTANFYSGDTPDFGSAALLTTLTPRPAGTRKFDCSLNTASAQFEALFT